MTKEKAREAAQVMLAWADGKEVECKYPYGWDKVDMPSWDWLVFTYRIKPTATLRPWTADEVPLGAWIRETEERAIRRIIVSTLDESFRLKWLQHYEHSTDSGKTWLPCGVVEEVK